MRPIEQIPPSFRAIGVYVLNALQAVFGTVLIESGLYRAIVYHPKTREMAIAKEDLFTITVAFVTGFFIFYRLNYASSKWVWVAGVCWFGILAVPMLAAHSGTLSSEFSGIGCSKDPAGAACLNWLEGTLPFFRTVFYSLGAFFASSIKPARNIHVVDAAPLDANE